MENTNGSFRIFVPAELVKAKSQGGKKKMILKGVASTAVVDSQGESLDPNGFDISYLLKHGYINWDHQSKKDPLSLIGRPTANTKIEKGQMLIEAELFEDNPRAVDAFQLQGILEKAGLGLGWSIEGKALERGAKKPGEPGYNIVKKARITGVALTPNPINQDTVAQIAKSESLDLPLSAYSNSSEEEQSTAMKGMNTENARAVIPESVEDELKNTQAFSKGDVYKKLFEDYPTLDMDSADRIYKLTEDIEKSINSNIMEENPNDIQVSEDALNKAYEVLGLNKSEAATEDASIEETVDVTDGDVEKGETEDLHQEVIDASIDILKSAGYNTDVLVKGEASEESEEEKEEDKPDEDDMEKSDNVVDIIKSEIGALRKERTEKDTAVGTLIKGFGEKLEILEKTVGHLAMESPGIRSIQTSSFLEKGEPGGQLGTQEKTISLSQNKAQVMNILDEKSGLSKSEVTDPALADSLCQYESSSYADDNIVKALQEEGFTVTR